MTTQRAFVDALEAMLEAAGYTVVDSPFTLDVRTAVVLPNGQADDGDATGYYPAVDIAVGATYSEAEGARDALVSEQDRLTGLLWAQAQPEQFVPGPASIDSNPIIFGDETGGDEQTLLVIIVPVRAVK